MIRYYLSIRLKQFWRFFSFNQFNPILGLVLLLAIFLFVSVAIYEKTTYASWIYMSIAIISISEFQQKQANEFLKYNVDSRSYYWVKLIENAMFAIPFIAFLLYENSMIQALIFVVFVLLYSFFNYKIPKPKLKALKSPFLSHAIEWHNTMRTYIVVFVLQLLLLIPAAISDNFYVFAVMFFILLFFINLTYSTVESEFMIWVYRTTTNSFLLKKLKTLSVSYFSSVLLFFVVGVAFYHTHWQFLVLLILLGYLSVLGSMLIKYQFYPHEVAVQISQLIFFGLIVGSFINPAMAALTVLIMLYAYFKAKRKIKFILKC